MKYLFVLVILMITSCIQESMSNEQQQQLKAEKAVRKIQRVTDADILNAARTNAVYKLNKSDSNMLNQIRWVALQDSSSNAYEHSMQQAYQYAIDQGIALYENIEDLKDGSIVFTKPGVLQDSIQGFWIITLDKSEVIKGLQ